MSFLKHLSQLWERSTPEDEALPPTDPPPGEPDDSTDEDVESPENDSEAGPRSTEPEDGPDDFEQLDQSQLSANPAPDHTSNSPDPPWYPDNLTYLLDEFRRIDFLLRATAVRWRHLLAQHKDPEDWGMIKVDHAEVNAYLDEDASWVAPGEPPAKIRSAVERIWDAAAREWETIDARVGQESAIERGDLRLPRLRAHYSLTTFERDVLLVCLLGELDDRYRRLMAYLQDDASRTQPTIELLLNVLPAPLYNDTSQAERRALFSQQGKLLRNHLLVIGGEARGDEALSMRSLRLDDRIQRYLLGDDQLDDRLCNILRENENGSHPLILSEAAATTLYDLQAWLAALSQPRAVIFLHGPYGSSRRARALSLSYAIGKTLLLFDIPAALKSDQPWPRLVDLAYREARLQNAALFWQNAESLLEENNGQPPPVHHWDYLLHVAESADVLTFLGSEIPWEPAGYFSDIPYIHLECPLPDFPIRRRLWDYYLRAYGARGFDQQQEALTSELANDFAFTAGQIEDALVSACSIARRRADIDQDSKSDDPVAVTELQVSDIYEGCRRQSTRRLITLAQRIRPRPELRLEHVILPTANHLQLQEVYQREKNRSRLYSDLQFGRQLRLGKGLVVLFTGTSGTGKTMAAEALAGERQVDLYQVDMSAVVSKWVGETEKNINRVFAEVEGVNAILFFDEADALFGKRAEVKDAQDRWANMEVNYLLQRIEAYSGTVILASNLRQNIDDAFLRRIHMIVDFPFPSEDLRVLIYRQVFPETVAPPKDEALKRLAKRFRLSGGSIKNSVVDATFRALNAGRIDEGGRPQVTERDLVLATVREFQKLGRPVTPDDFRGEYYTWAVNSLLDPDADAGPRLALGENNGSARRVGFG